MFSFSLSVWWIMHNLFFFFSFIRDFIAIHRHFSERAESDAHCIQIRLPCRSLINIFTICIMQHQPFEDMFVLTLFFFVFSRLHLEHTLISYWNEYFSFWIKFNIIITSHVLSTNPNRQFEQGKKTQLHFSLFFFFLSCKTGSFLFSTASCVNKSCQSAVLLLFFSLHYYCSQCVLFLGASAMHAFKARKFIELNNDIQRSIRNQSAHDM